MYVPGATLIVSPETATPVTIPLPVALVIHLNGVPEEVPLFVSFPVATFTYHVVATAVVVPNKGIATAKSRQRSGMNRLIRIEASIDCAGFTVHVIHRTGSSSGRNWVGRIDCASILSSSNTTTTDAQDAPGRTEFD